MKRHEVVIPFHAAKGYTERDWVVGCDKERQEEYAGHVDGYPSWVEHTFYMADATGHMLIDEVQRVQIDGYEDRIFYLCTWRDPDGNEFGKKKLRCKGARAFALMVKCWRHPYWLDGELVNPKEAKP